MTTQRIRVAHIITGLGIGGAEMMLHKLVSGMDKRTFEAIIISLTDNGPVGDMIRTHEIPVLTLGMNGKIRDGLAELKLVRVLRACSPDIVQTWMYHANLFGGIATRFLGDAPIVWGLHHGNRTFKGYRETTRLVVRASAAMSSLIPQRIVCCSEAVRRTHVELGYPERSMVVIENGFDCTLFRPNPEARRKQRSRLGITEDTPLVGCVSRFHPQKDHRTFVRAASLLHDVIPDAHFLLCGPGISWDNPQLAEWIRSENLVSQFRLLPSPQDIPTVTATFDVATLSSISEGFPNAVGEAMACEVPCVVTDVGDAATMVGETGIAVPHSNPRALSEGWRMMLSLSTEERRNLGKAARMQILGHYSLASAIAAYENVYKRLLKMDVALVEPRSVE